MNNTMIVARVGGRFFHSKGTWGCAAHKGIHFWTSSLAKAPGGALVKILIGMLVSFFWV